MLIGSRETKLWANGATQFAQSDVHCLYFMAWCQQYDVLPYFKDSSI